MKLFLKLLRQAIIELLLVRKASIELVKKFIAKVVEYIFIKVSIYIFSRVRADITLVQNNKTERENDESRVIRRMGRDC